MKRAGEALLLLILLALCLGEQTIAISCDSLVNVLRASYAAGAATTAVLEGDCTLASLPSLPDATRQTPTASSPILAIRGGECQCASIVVKLL